MRLYKGIWKNYGNGALLERWWDEQADRLGECLYNDYDNKSYARELMVLYRAMEPILKKLYKPQNGWYSICGNREGIAEACEAIHKKYWKRFHKKFYAKWTKRDGAIPHMPHTQALREFLAMGFVYKTEMEFDIKNYYYIYSHIGGLWWPEAFDQHMHALQKMAKIGIGGLTGTTLLKNK